MSDKLEEVAATVKRIETALCGDKHMRIPGALDRLATVENRVTDLEVNAGISPTPAKRNRVIKFVVTPAAVLALWEGAKAMFHK